MVAFPLVRVLAICAVCLSVAACKSSEERADEHFQDAQALIAKGDDERAIVELKNVFQLSPNHHDAHIAMAQLLLARGDLPGAYGQYLKVTETSPRDLEARVSLAEIAFRVRRWDDLDRNGQIAEEIAPDDPRVKIISLARRYRTAVTGNDVPARQAVVAEAGQLIAQKPDSWILHSIRIDDSIRNQNYSSALDGIDKLIALDPKNRDLYNQRLQVLVQLKDNSAIEAQLKDMLARFPDDPTVKGLLVRFYMSQKDIDGAEAFLRQYADFKAADPGPVMDLIRFLADQRGPEAARAEIEKGIAESPDPVPFKALKAGLDFNAGKHDAAVGEMEAILKDAKPSNETRNIKVTLAKMQQSMGNEVGARRLVEEVLAEDAGNVEALKMRAAWQINDDDTDGAIATLRTARDNAQTDPQVLTLMAQAYDRAGNHDLSRDSLSQAVKVSGNAPAETLRYARLLIADKTYLPAEDVLLPALRLSPDNVELLGTLGQLYLAMQDEPRTKQVIDTLRRLDQPQAKQAANALEAAQLNQKGGSEEVMSFLQSLAGGADGDVNAKLALLRAKLASGKNDDALAYAQQLVDEAPGNDQLRFALAATKGATGDLDGAQAIYDELLKKNPKQPLVWLRLSGVQTQKGDVAKAEGVIDDGLKAIPDDPTLLLSKAAFLERNHDIDGAIAIYQKLYDQSSQSVVVANNLASLLSTYRTDKDSQDKAWVIARRLEGTRVPAFQDTYGWLAYGRGQYKEALPYLQNAAEALKDPMVYYHLGMTYEALDQKDDAKAAFQNAVDAAGPNDTRPQIVEARDALAGKAPPAPTPAPAPESAADPAAAPAADPAPAPDAGAQPAPPAPSGN